MLVWIKLKYCEGKVKEVRGRNERGNTAGRGHERQRRTISEEEEEERKIRKRRRRRGRRIRRMRGKKKKKKERKKTE